MKNIKLFVVFIITAAFFAALPAAAQTSTATGTGTVTATVTKQCTVQAFTLAFGSYDPVVANATTPLDAQAAITVYCTKGTTGTVSLNLGSNASGSTRRMTAGAGMFLNYEVYSDSARATIWNTTNTASATSTSKNTPLNGASGFAAYGRVAAGQDVFAGSYSDTITATVNF